MKRTGGTAVASAAGLSETPKDSGAVWSITVPRSGPVVPQPLRPACGVSIATHPTMARTPQNAKKAKVSISKPQVKKREPGKPGPGSKVVITPGLTKTKKGKAIKARKTGKGNMVVLVPTKTRRGKTIYTEVDAAPYYQSSDEEGKNPKRSPSKTPSNSKMTVPASKTTVPAPLEDTPHWGASCLDDQEPHLPRVTKV